MVLGKPESVQGLRVYLQSDVFETVVASTPLVSIDLVVENDRGEILLGLRNNRPAQGYWFVPGGRVMKNESLDVAFTRLIHNELDIEWQRCAANFLGVYEHLYDDSVFGDQPDTHYVVLAYHLRHDLDLNGLPSSQHNDYRWWSPTDMVDSDRVHLNSRAYLSALA